MFIIASGSTLLFLLTNDPEKKANKVDIALVEEASTISE
jgi:hypothetical protein